MDNLLEELRNPLNGPTRKGELCRKAADEIERLRAALKFIAGMKDMTLIAPSHGPIGDQSHQIGASKAFNQAADVAIAALKE